MSIENKIRDMVLELTTSPPPPTPPLTADPYEYTFYHCEAEELNRMENKVKFPFAHLDFPLVGEDEILPATNGRIKTTYQLRIFFALKSDLQNNQEQRQSKIELMRQAKCEFETKLFADPDIEIIGKPTHTSVIEAIDFDFSCDGIYLNLKLSIDETPAC